MAVYVNFDDKSKSASTPYVKRSNTGGATTLVQDPSKYYISQGAENLQNKNANAVYNRSTGGGGGSSTAAAAVSSGGGGGGYSDGGGGGGFDWMAYLAELQRQKQERADAAYRRNMERIASAYNSANESLKGNYDSTVDRLNVARDNSMSDVNTDAEKSLREAYINSMLTKKNLNQRLSAMGYNGGATESTMAKLENQYGNSRSGINETLNKNISDLDMKYGDNLANALESYNNAKANLDLQKMQLEMQAEAARAAAEESYSASIASLTGGDSSYLAALQNALSSQSNYTYSPTVATNDYVAGNVTQGQGATADNNYAKYLAQAQLDASNGANRRSIINKLFGARSNGDLDITAVYKILAQLGMVS